jgi:hypothetical protein
VVICKETAMKNDPYGIRRAAEPCIKGNAQLKSFVRSPHMTGVCNVLQDRGEESGSFSLAGLREVVSGLGAMGSPNR